MTQLHCVIMELVVYRRFGPLVLVDTCLKARSLPLIGTTIWHGLVASYSRLDRFSYTAVGRVCFRCHGST